MSNFEKVRSYLQELDIDIINEVPEDEVFVVNNEDRGICNMIIDCEDHVLIIEQAIYPTTPSLKECIRLLQINRSLVHGAFILNEEANMVIFRDTLELENLDLNELEASLHALSIGLVEYATDILTFANAEVKA